jgi:hypothetical protein
MEDILRANKYTKRYPVSLSIREMQIKTSRRYQYTTNRMAKFRNLQDQGKHSGLWP